MANTTMTSREFFNAVIEGKITDEIKDFAKSQIEKLDSKNAKRKTTDSKTQKENKAIKETLLATMEKDKVYTASEISGMEIEGITSTQKASALLRQMTETGELTVTDIKIKGKGKVKGYSLVSPAQEISDNSTVEELD